MKLVELARTVRSKNAGPLKLTRSVERPLSPIEKDLLPITATETHDLKCAIAGPMQVQDLATSAGLVPRVKVCSETQGAD